MCHPNSASSFIFSLFQFGIYPIPAKNNLCFLQDYILGHPDSNKKTSTYLANVSDIKRHM